MTTNECVIYDFETLSQNPQDGVVTSFALLAFSESRYIDNPYTFEELIDSCRYIKFDIDEQVKLYKRKMMKDTVQWWDAQGPEAKKQIIPTDTDVSIDELYDFLVTHIDLKSHKKAFTRGNTFDPVFLDSVLGACGRVNPMHWGNIRDTRSMIEGMSFGMKLSNSYMPDAVKGKFVKHDPRHDISLDVMRMQLLAQAILGN